MNEPLTREEMNLLLSLGGDNAGDSAGLQMQQRQADMLRQSAPQMQTRGAGRLQVAPHPLEVLGNVGLNFMANRKEKGALDSQKRMGDRTQQQNALILRGLFNRGGPGASPGTPTPDPYYPE